MRKEIIGDATLYLGDCLEILPTLPKVDAVVTDPPYFKVKDEAWDRQWKKPEQFIAWLRVVLGKCSERMQPWASIFVFADPDMEWYVQAEVRSRFHFINSIRWRKALGWHRKQKVEDMRAFQTNWEACIFGQKGNDDDAMELSGYDAACKALHRKVYAPLGDYFKKARLAAGVTYKVIADHIERDSALYLRWEEGSSLPNPDDYAKCRMIMPDLRREYEDLRREYEDLRRPFLVFDRRMVGDIWDYDPVPPGFGKHPCEKPTGMMEHIVGTSTRKGHAVIDPFMGSGTTGVACAKLGRKFIGIELEEKYFEIACKRIEEAYKQPDLFVPAPEKIKQEVLI